MKYTNGILTVIAALLLVLGIQNSGSSIFSTVNAAPAPFPSNNVTKVVLCNSSGEALSTGYHYATPCLRVVTPK